MELFSMNLLGLKRHIPMYQKIFWILFILAVVFMFLPLDTFCQYDYVPEMEKFPDIDITHYDLFAEFRTDTAKIKAKAIVEFQVKEAAANYVMFEIDRRVKILKVINCKIYIERGMH